MDSHRGGLAKQTPALVALGYAPRARRGIDVSRGRIHRNASEWSWYRQRSGARSGVAGQDGAIALLIHLNGAPGVGKSSVARRYLDDHPLALVLEIDDIRTRLGQWKAREESKLLARDLALAMAEAQLRSGHDVVVPQYLGRTDFVLRLEEVAKRCDAAFIEVLLAVDRSVTTERFRSRREDLLAWGEAHPQADVSDLAVEEVIADAFDRVEHVARERSSTMTIAAGGDVEQTYSELLAAVHKTLS